LYGQRFKGEYSNSDNGRQQSSKEVSRVCELCELGSTSECVMLMKYGLVV